MARSPDHASAAATSSLPGWARASSVSRSAASLQVFVLDLGQGQEVSGVPFARMRRNATSRSPSSTTGPVTRPARIAPGQLKGRFRGGSAATGGLVPRAAPPRRRGPGRAATRPGCSIRGRIRRPAARAGAGTRPGNAAEFVLQRAASAGNVGRAHGSVQTPPQQVRNRAPASAAGRTARVTRL